LINHFQTFANIISHKMKNYIFSLGKY